MNDQYLQIRPMLQTDIETIVALERECDLSSWGIAGYAQEILSSDALLLVAIWQNNFAGFFSGRILTDEFELFTIAVAPEFRRKGIAQNLLENAISKLKERQVKKYFLEVRATNFAAIALYQGFGFEVIGRRPNYYQNPNEDALLMGMTISLPDNTKFLSSL